MELYPDIVNKNNKNKCDKSNQIALLTNQAVIFYHNKYKQISLKAKLQAEKGLLDNKYLTYKYQYINFEWTDNLSDSAIKEYYYDIVSKGVSQIPYEYYSNHYTITKLKNNTLKIEINYERKKIYVDINNSMDVGIKNTYILEKKDNDTIELINKNEAL